MMFFHLTNLYYLTTKHDLMANNIYKQFSNSEDYYFNRKRNFMLANFVSLLITNTTSSEIFLIISFTSYFAFKSILYTSLKGAC